MARKSLIPKPGVTVPKTRTFNKAPVRRKARGAGRPI